MAGLQPCILRSTLPGDDGSLICFFAPLRIQEPVALRTSIAGDPGLEYSRSPSSDIRLKIRMSDEVAHTLLAANILAKAERSPLFMVDLGSDGKDPKLVLPATLVTSQFVAGSMGLICRVPADQELINSLQRLAAGPYEVIVDLCKLVNQIFHQWPGVDISLRPGISDANEDPLRSRLQILHDLVKIAPLIAGCFAPMCGSSHHLEDQIMARASCNALRLRDLTVKDLEADDKYLLRIYVSLRRILLHPLTPVWPFHLLEDILSVPIQELIRYSPDLFHLRSRNHYGEPHAIAKSDARSPSHLRNGSLSSWTRT